MAGGADPEGVRNVLSYPAFRRLWIALSVSSFGDWLGLLATTALAADLTGGGVDGTGAAIGGVFFFRLLPALLFGPVAGVFADRFDRRRLMVFCDIARFSLFASIPFVPHVSYLLFASFLIESFSLFWIPAKEASVPNLLPAARLESANQLSLISTYGTAPIAAAVFAGLALVSRALGAAFPFFKSNPTDLAFYFNAATFLFTAFTVWRLKEIRGARRSSDESPATRTPSFLDDLREGGRFLTGTPLVRGIVVGIVGACAAAGAVVGLGYLFAQIQGGGNAAYGILFGTVIGGLAIGMGLGPKVLRAVSRRRKFGVAIFAAGVSLSLMALTPNLLLALLATLAVGFFAGVAWVTGYTLLGGEIEDEVRGRTFAAVQSLMRITLMLSLGLAPGAAALIGDHSVTVGAVRFRLDGPTVILFVGGLIAMGVGFFAYRQMDDGTRPLWTEIGDAVRRRTGLQVEERVGTFIVLEGGEGVGKSTQVGLLADRLRLDGCDVVTTFEPGATALGKKIRSLLLDRRTVGLTARAEALLYAADRAQHVATVVRPALDRGAVVVSDRYIDSSLAYQGGGRALSADEVAQLSSWATGSLVPDLTVVLDVTPEVGLLRLRGSADRMESESLEFHQRVREAFLALAGSSPSRYAVVDATRDPESVHTAIVEAVWERLGPRLATAAPPPGEASSDEIDSGEPELARGRR
ncbi:MAG TPA: dTMP kinase [Mycobacteriales bacterium]|nr:dTMP kinase [Mycobacteriales bacterium]